MANPITKIFITAVDKTKAAFASAKSGLVSLGSAASSLKGTLGSIFVGLSVAGLVGALKQTIDEMDRVDEAAARVGTSAENFSALKYAAEQNGVGIDELEGALGKLSRGLDQAKDGTGAAAEAFRRLNIDPAQFTDPTEALAALADRFAQLPDGVTKAALAQDLFGRSGAALIPLLNQGRAGLAELRAEAEALGIVMSGESTAAAAQFNDNLDKLKAAGSGLGVTLANEILPGLNEITNAMANAARQGGVTAAAIEAIKFIGTDFLTNQQLSATYRLAEAEKQLNSLRKDGFEEDHKRVKQLNDYIPLLKVLADQEKATADAKREATAESSKAAENRKAEQKELKEATEEQISDAARLKDALQTAFTQSLAAETDYLRQAKKLRAEANKPAEIDDSVEAQASAKLDATIAAMKLQREASTASLEQTQAQADAVRALAEQLTDAAAKADLLRQANLAEATALEKAAAEEGARAAQQAEQIRAVETQTTTLQGALDGIGKPATVEVTAGPGVQKAIEDLTAVKHLIDYISANPVSVNVSGAGTDALKTAALQYGRR